MTTRTVFIPELKEKIKADLQRQGLQGKIVDDSFKKWEAGEKASTPWEKGCFAVFEKIQSEIETMGGI